MSGKQRFCLECGEPIVGRSDKKFCSDYCRNAYNNRLNRASNAVIRNTNNKLKKNWRILNELNPEGKTKVHKKRLLDKGFDFEYITSIYKTKKNDMYFYVYDQGYLELDNGYYMLVKKFDK
jgi:predicted nucleic acid-binding Zn ribbon protein